MKRFLAPAAGSNSAALPVSPQAGEHDSGGASAAQPGLQLRSMADVQRITEATTEDTGVAKPRQEENTGVAKPGQKADTEHVAIAALPAAAASHVQCCHHDRSSHHRTSVAFDIL